MGIHEGHRDRMKQEFLQGGLAHVSEPRVLELLLFYSRRQGDVNPLAHQLLDTFGSLAGVLDASPDDLRKVPGVGENTVVLLKLIPAIAARYLASRTSAEVILSDSATLHALFTPYFFGARNEKLAQERDLHLHAAHFNHQLRGEESQRDETFVTEWCQQRNIPLIIGQGDVAQEAKAQGKGVEETARAMRYGFLTQAAQDLGADKLATAHHADDNAETVLLHLVRGAGLDGLTGIPPVRGILIRPLLAIPQSDIAAYLEQEGIPHVEDSSNFDLTYARNRLRQEVVPVLQELNPAFISTLTANLDHLREDRDLLEGMAQRAIQEARVTEGRVSIPASTLAALDHPIAVRAVKLLLAKVEYYQISSVHLDQILALAASTSPSASHNLPGDLFVWREYDRLVMSPAANMPAAFSLRLITGPGTFPLDNGWTITVEETLCPDPPEQGEYAWHIAQSTVTYPLILRPRQVGDQLRLPGRRTKTLKKWYIDEKIPRQNREMLPVLADEAGLLGAAGLGPNYPRLAQPGQPALYIQLTAKHRPTPDVEETENEKGPKET